MATFAPAWGMPGTAYSVRVDHDPKLAENPSMDTLRDLHRTLSAHTRDIVDAFNTATEREPWAKFAGEDRINSLRQVIEPFIALALVDSTEVALCRSALRAAAKHGEHRRNQGLPDETIFQDLYYFRKAVCSQLERDLPLELYTHAHARIDHLLALVASASLRGYYRGAYEARGDWPRVVDALEAMVEPCLKVGAGGKANPPTA